MAPKTRGGSSRGRRGQPSTQHQQLQPATEPDTSAQAAVPTPPDPVTPICRTALFHVPPYNPRPIPARPSSPDEEEFDFDEADAIPITAPPPAAGVTYAARKIWRSNVYDHYITTVNRICDPFSHQPLKIEFVFTLLCLARLQAVSQAKPGKNRPGPAGPNCIMVLYTNGIQLSGKACTDAFFS
ncbi:hypothetical protein BYT27DRAFT_7209397 [Phlegmacium glaucopus]|nr:hypothetical protein BYT27DRAFT_7209397 [Phlegmacium glaucopus]